MTLPEVLDWVPDVELPRSHAVGSTGEWTLPSGEDLIVFTGTFLGMGTSKRDVHQHDGPHAKEFEFCRACRWFEPRIFRDTITCKFLVHRTGASIVPGEVPLTSHEWFASPYEVVEALTTRRNRTAFLTRPAARALAQAAAEDEDLQDAYVNRAVS